MRNLMIVLALAAMGVATAGCVSPQQQAVNECTALGLQLGTNGFANCYELSMQRRQAAGIALIQAGTALQAQRPTVTTANCTRLGSNTVNCVGVSQ